MKQDKASHIPDNFEMVSEVYLLFFFLFIIIIIEESQG